MFILPCLPSRSAMIQKCNHSLLVVVFVVEMLVGTGTGCTSMIGGGGGGGGG